MTLETSKGILEMLEVMMCSWWKPPGCSVFHTLGIAQMLISHSWWLAKLVTWKFSSTDTLLEANLLWDRNLMLVESAGILDEMFTCIWFPRLDHMCKTSWFGFQNTNIVTKATLIKMLIMVGENQKNGCRQGGGRHFMQRNMREHSSYVLYLESGF